MEIKFQTPRENKRHIRLGANSILSFRIKVDKDNAIPVSSEFAKKNKLLIYPDLLMKGNAEITVYNMSSYFMDLRDGDLLAELKYLHTPERENHEQTDSEKELSN